MGLYVLVLGVLWMALVKMSGSANTPLQECLPGGGVDPTRMGPAQKQAQDRQFEISCDVNLTVRELFLQKTLQQLGMTGKLPRNRLVDNVVAVVVFSVLATMAG